MTRAERNMTEADVARNWPRQVSALCGHMVTATDKRDAERQSQQYCHSCAFDKMREAAWRDRRPFPPHQWRRRG